MSYVKRRLWYQSSKAERQGLGDEEILGRSEPMVILGEPGMGKSKLLENLAGVAELPLFTARQLINRPDPKSLTGGARLVIIDALDEVAARREGDAVDLVLQKLGALDYPRFVLSCRVADWQAATSTAAIREQYFDAPLQLHLEPLGRADQLAVLAAQVGSERAETLIEHFERSGLDFLGNPQTLDLIARLPMDRPLPSSRGALFELAIEKLRVEHRNAGGGAELARDVALDAAGAAFAGLILSNSAKIVRHGSANLAEGEVHISEVDELADGKVAHVINTRLFAGGDDSFTYWHRRIGEFLGAEWLAKRADTRVKRRRLLQLFHAQKLVPASLRGLHAWLARDPQLAETVIAADPMGVIEYGDADALTPQQALTMLTALQRIASENPNFWRWGNGRARALVSPALCHDVALILRDKAAAVGLRALLTEQLIDGAVAGPFRKTLRDALLDSKEVFALRRRAGDALTTLTGEDWPKLVEELRCQGDSNARRLAFELMQEIGIALFSDVQVLQTILAYACLTLLGWPPEQDESLTLRFWRLPDRVPVERLDGLLEILTDYLRELLPRHAGLEEREPIALVHKLVVRRLKAGPVEPLRVWRWLSPYADQDHTQHSFGREETDAVAAWLREHDDVRRAIQGHVVLDDSATPLWRKAAHLSRVSAGLALTEGDIVALLGSLDPGDRSDLRWRDLLGQVPHNREVGAAAREAARAFAAHDPQLLDWLDRLAEPAVPEWKAKQDVKSRQRAAKRAAQFAEHRRDFLANLDKVLGGDFGWIFQPARAYLNLFYDIDDCAAHERIARWLGEDVANAAHQGFEAFLTRQPVYVNAKRIAVCGAHGRALNAGLIIVAALAERVRTRSDPFLDLPGERLMAGLFEVWCSSIDDHAKLSGLRERIEAELKRRGTWEAALRLYIVPQLKRRLAHVDNLYALMRSEADATLADSLAVEWLRSCKDMAAAPEAEMVDRLLHSSRRGELCAIGDARRGTLADDERRRNWDAVQILVDFDAASVRLSEPVEPDLLWRIRARGGEGKRDERAPATMRPRQLAWIVAVFRKSFSAQGRPSGSTYGDRNPWDASDYLFGLISRLGDDTSDDAVAALGALLAAPHDGYTTHMRAVAAEQRQKRVEMAYVAPTLPQIRSILSAGPAIDAPDLQAVTLDALDTVQGWLRGNDVDWYRGFFREDGGHKAEEPCRDEIIKMLRAVDNSLEYFPETHVADDKRVDIVVRANKALILPIEVKGQWHAELWTAADKQLDHLYVNDWRAERGIYLVLWFGESVSLSSPPDGNPKSATAVELRKTLHATSKAVMSGRVDIVVLDLTRPSP